MASLSFTRNTDNPLRYASGVMNYVNKSWSIVRYCQGTEIVVAGGNYSGFDVVTTAETSRGWTVYDTDPYHVGVSGDPPAGQTNVNLTINPPSTALAGRYAFINPIGDGAPGACRSDFYLDQDSTSLFPCSADALRGCTNRMATNYNPQAQVDDGSCIFPVRGCTNPRATNYNSLATIDDGTCILPPPVPGCTNPSALNYNRLATVDDGSCILPPPPTLPISGCTNPAATNYNPLATVDNGSCILPPPIVRGCTDPRATNYNALATVSDSSCVYPPGTLSLLGCTDHLATNYNPLATIDDGTCIYPPSAPIHGCTNPKANNYNPLATIEDGSCLFSPPPTPIHGCTDPNALNYNPLATINDGSCTYPSPPSLVRGCTDPRALNYNSLAKVDDGSCTYPPPPLSVSGCTDPNALNYNTLATVDDGSCRYPPPSSTVQGCTDSKALNYNSLATIDDGSCTYSPGLAPTGYTYTLTYEDIPTPNDVESIPRVRTTMKRKPGSTFTTPSRGKTLLIVGCALDGPTDYIVSLQDLRQASTLYGPQLFNADYPAPAGSSALNGYWSGNTLIKSIGETKGISDVRLLRVGGTFAQGQDLVPGLHLKALYAGASYNGASVTLTSDLGATVFAVTPPRIKGRPYTLRIPSGRTLEQLCSLFNADPRNQAFILSVDGSASRMTAQTISPEASTSVLSGGRYGTEYDLYPTPADLYRALLGTATWDIIQGSNEDMIYVAGIYADDDIGSPNHSFALDLGQLCIDKSIEGLPTLATIGLRPLNNPNLRTVANRVASLSTPSFTYDSDSRVNVAQFLSDGLTNAAGEDLGRFVSICAGPDLIFTGNDLNAYVESPACWYASFACSTISPSTTTNKSVPSDLQPNWRFTHKQLNLLNGGVGFGGENAININATEGGGAYVALKQQPFGRGWCIVEDVTTSPRNSAFAHLYVSRILKSAEEVVQSVTYPYIGQTNASAVITAMDRQLTQVLDKFAGTGALQGARDSGYGYRLWSTVEGQFLGIIYLTLWLLPVGEIHRIDSIITVTG